MKKTLAFYLMFIASSIAASDTSNFICNATICRRAVVESNVQATVTTAFLLQCLLWPAMQQTQSSLMQSSCKPLKIDAQQTCSPKNFLAVAPYGKKELSSNIKIRRNGRLQQPKK